jgi:hypothetical protein
MISVNDGEIAGSASLSHRRRLFVVVQDPGEFLERIDLAVHLHAHDAIRALRDRGNGRGRVVSSISAESLTSTRLTSSRVGSSPSSRSRTMISGLHSTTLRISEKAMRASPSTRRGLVTPTRSSKPAMTP